MKASFGKLRNAELLLEDGLNIINLPNEAGKSTWSAFIRAMLYGINTSERDRAGYLADKTKYRPWGEYPMEGAMDIIWRGREITLTRKSKGSGLMGYSEAYYTGTSEPCPELSGKSPGDILIGVPEQVFRRSAFISRPSMALDKDTELEKRISALVTSGDEDTSYTEASERLGKWLRKRNRKPSGLLIGIEAKIQKLEERLERLEKKMKTLRFEKREGNADKRTAGPSAVPAKAQSKRTADPYGAIPTKKTGAGGAGSGDEFSGCGSEPFWKTHHKGRYRPG